MGVAAMIFVLGLGAAGAAAAQEQAVGRAEAPPFEPAVYRNDQLGLSVSYPADWEIRAPNPGGLFKAVAPNQVTTVDVAAGPWTDRPPEALFERIAASLVAMGGEDAKLAAVREVTLRDGTTPATETLVEWYLQSLPLSTLTLFTRKDDQRISVTVTWTVILGGDRAAQHVDDIAYSLGFD